MLSRSGLERLLSRGLAGALRRVLPPRMRVGVRERLEVVGRLDTDAAEVWLAADSLFEYDVRLRSCRKEPGTVRWITEHVRAGDVVYDVGANVGAYTLLAARRAPGRVRVYAFEPSFSNYAQLCRNVILNRCDAVVFPLPVALSDVTVLDALHHRTLVTGAAMHAFGRPEASAGEAFEAAYRQPALGYRLDDLVAQFGLPIPDHIKIDVDGLEARVLAGAERTLKESRLRTVLVEVLAGSASEASIATKLTTAGLRQVSAERFPLAGGQVAYNALWAREETA